MWFSLPLLAATLWLAPEPVAAQESSCDECPGLVWRVNAGSKAPVPDGTTWATAFRRVQDAVSRAKNGDCIWVAAGRYFTSSLGNRQERFKISKSLTLYGGFAGYEACLSSRAGLFAATFLSGDIGTSAKTDNAYTVVDVSGAVSFGQPSPDVVLDGFHIRGAYSHAGFGGAIYFGEHGLELRNCLIADNDAGYGAGLYARSGRLDIVSSTFRNNRARIDGGAMWLGGVRSGRAGTGGVKITNVVLRGNTAKGKGGGLYLTDPTLTGTEPLLFTNTLLRGNAAKLGGAGYLEEAQSNGGFPGGALAQMVNCTIVDNVATGGAAFFVEDSKYLLAKNAQLDLTDCIVWGNLPSNPVNPAIVAITGEGLLVGHTLLESGSPHACQPAFACTNDPGCTVFDCDPLFLAAPKYHPDPGVSPAIDSGLGALPPDVFDLDGDGDVLEPTPFDLDGDPRAQGAVDRGAYEAP